MDFQIDLDALARPNLLPKPKITAMPSEEDIKKTINKAYLDSLHQFYKTAFLKEHVRAFCEEGKTPNKLTPELQIMMDNQANTLMTKPPYMLLTINPRPDVSLAQLKKVVEKIVSKKTITHYAYVYEVRKKDSGLHCHMLLKYTDKPYSFQRGLKNTAKHICTVNHKEIFNMKYIEEDHVPEKISYFLGNKKDSKKAGVIDTVAYRKAQNLETMYESSPPLPCRATQITHSDSPPTIELIN